MKDLSIIDNFLDEREFRNYVHHLLVKNGYSSVTIDDERLADNTKINDNDMLATKDNITYTVQTFLNVSIGKGEVDETYKDMDNENVVAGIIVTNSKVYDEIKAYAKDKSIEIWDRDFLEKSI